MQTDPESQARVLDHAAEIPLVLDLVAGLVVALGTPAILHLATPLAAVFDGVGAVFGVLIP